MLNVKDLNAWYGHVHAIDGISLTVEQGEIVTIIGSNGAGKSTTLRAISGMIKKTLGEISFKGQDIQGLSSDRIVSMGLGHVPEGRRIFPRLTVEENLDIGAYLLKDRKVIDERKQKGFELFPILHKRRTQKGGTLSGGEQQMLAIARALMQDPELLLMDEPSMGLAPVLVDFIFETIVALNKQGKTILLVEQNARMALGIATRAYVLQSGHLKVEGKASDLAADPDVQKAYLGKT